MTAPSGVTILTNPTISPSQLFTFYQRNNICEANFGQAVAAKVLTGSSLIVAAFVGHKAWTRTEKDWRCVKGGTMYRRHADEATYPRWLAEAGSSVEWRKFIPESDGGHVLVLAKKTPPC